MAVEGLKNHRQKKEEARQSGNSVFLRIADGDKVLIRPLQELDEDASNFVADAGVAVFNIEWSNPDDFTKVISDTMESEGRCVGREKSREKTGRKIMKKRNGKEQEEDETGWDLGWKSKEFMYLNVLVDDGENEPVIKVAKFNMAPKAAQSNALIDCYENNGSITDRWFAYSRTGSGKNSTTYKLAPKDRDESLPAVTSYGELHDLNALLPDVPYARQREVLGLSGTTQETTAAPTQAPATVPEW